MRRSLLSTGMLEVFQVLKYLYKADRLDFTSYWIANEPRRKTTRLRKPQKLLLTSWCPRRNVTVIRFIAICETWTVLGNNSLLLFVYTILN
jgi:hypothetical protein